MDRCRPRMGCLASIRQPRVPYVGALRTFVLVAAALELFEVSLCYVGSQEISGRAGTPSARIVTAAHRSTRGGACSTGYGAPTSLARWRMAGCSPASAHASRKWRRPLSAVLHPSESCIPLIEIRSSSGTRYPDRPRGEHRMLRDRGTTGTNATEMIHRELFSDYIPSSRRDR